MPRQFLRGVFAKNGVEAAFDQTLFLTIGCAHLSLIFTGEINAIHAAVMIGSLFAAIRPERFQRVPSVVWNALSILILAGSLAAALAPPHDFENYFHGLAYFLIYMVIIQHLTRKTARDELILLLLAMLEVCAASIMTISLLFLVSIILFSGFLVTGLMLFSIKQEYAALRIRALQVEKIEREAGGRTAEPAGKKLLPAAPSRKISPWFYGFSFVSALVISLLGMGTFFLIPRVGRSLFAWRTGIHSRVSGFSDTVEFGAVGRVKLNNTLVMRVQVEGSAEGPRELYFRGNALDHFDGRKWNDSQGIRKVRFFRYQETVNIGKVVSLRDAVKQEIILEPIESAVLFAMPRVKAVSAPMRFSAIVEYWNDYISLPLDTPIYDRITYTAWSVPPLSDPSACDSAWENYGDRLPRTTYARFLQMPEGMDEVRDLARKVVGAESSPCRKAVLVRDYLETNYAYDLDTPSDQAPDPTSDFLFKSKRGYCQHFATAMVLMLRSVGVPARLATGYLGGNDWNPIDQYLRIKESDAHTWVETYLPGEEDWMMFDPTPAVSQEESEPAWSRWIGNVLDSIKYRWDRYVVDLSLRDQYHMAVTFRNRGTTASRSLSRLPSRAAKVLWSLVRGPAVLVFLLMAIALYFLWIRKSGGITAVEKKKKTSQVAAEYMKLLTEVEKTRGVKRRPSQTPLEIVRMVDAESFSFARAFSQATWLYLAVCFGDKNLQDRALASIGRAKKAVRDGQV